MMIVCLGGGLGNQMFQYAFYLALKEKYPYKELTMNIFDIFPENPHNGFELERVFGIKPKPCESRYILLYSDHAPKDVKHYKLLNKLFMVKKLFFGSKDSRIKQYIPTSYIPGVFELDGTKSYLLEGNWINEKYFAHIKEQVQTAFTFKEALNQESLNYEEQIKNTNSISVHVRKGDYSNSFMDILSMDYYQSAISILKEKVKNPVFYIFSDDKEFIRQQFQDLENKVIVTGNTGKDSFMDMYLMSQCKHNIVANSTFSFWGAYLNKNPEKIVIAPNKLWNSEEGEQGIYCDEWHILEV